MENILQAQSIDFHQNLINYSEKYSDFTLEIEGKIKNGKLECIINNINNNYTNYLKIKNEEIIGCNLFSIKDIFSSIYYEIANYFFKNATENSMNIYIKKNHQEVEIINLKNTKDVKGEIWQIIAYVFSRNTDSVKMFVLSKNISNELCIVGEKFGVKDIKSYNDIIMNLSSIVSNLSHAWRQPLNSLNFSIINLIDEMDSQTKNCQIVEQYYDEIWQIIKDLSGEIEKFKAFFEMDYKKEVFDIKKYLDLVFEILEQKMKKENIKIDIIAYQKIHKYGSPNEFLQIMYCIFFDFIEHYKEVFDINNRKLNIEIKSSGNSVLLDMKIIYNKDENKDYKLHLNHISMFNDIVHKRMGGTIDLINKGVENKLIVSFPLNL